ncbi:hypothetical protein N3K66_000245 [Trichothecium roseum]|uniref:Uncharacterized protein n=1 Tax=Trichothecium roseum TaxID=47278 RepID=A0ACC0VB87_9HYPO|nr:hypothetical protein N3K66_000245 [Trichothecium roseum]
MPDNGITSSYEAEGPLSYVMIGFLCVALYNVIELTPIIWTTFKRHSGLYFWSFIVSTYGIPFYCTGFLFKLKVESVSAVVYVTFIAVGWVAMVTGQSMVLWSRLHLVLQDPFKLRLIRWMIIIDALIMHVPTIIFIYGTNLTGSERWTDLYAIYEKIQVTVFFLQETVISSAYIIETVKLIRLSREIQGGATSRQLMNHLILVNVTTILLDMTILGLEYAGLYNIQTPYKALAYSIKLKIEFSILNRLVEMTTGAPDSGAYSWDGCETCGYKGGGAGSSAADGVSNIRLRPIRAAAMRRTPSVTYRARVRGGGDDPTRGLDRCAADARVDDSRDVIMTTEIVVQREARSRASDGLSLSDISQYTLPEGDTRSRGEGKDTDAIIGSQPDEKRSPAGH